MKRALLIAGGTLGGLGAVMAITPPQLNSSSNVAISGVVKASPSPSVTSGAQTTPIHSATKSAVIKPVKTKKPTSKAIATKRGAATTRSTATPTPVASTSVAPTPVASTGAVAVSGTFVGPAIFVNYGTVQVQITVKDGHIMDATALRAPTGRNSRYTDMALPVLKKQTLAAQSAHIQGASGASYTSYGWSTSLQGALSKAGL